MDFRRLLGYDLSSVPCWDDEETFAGAGVAAGGVGGGRGAEGCTIDIDVTK